MREWDPDEWIEMFERKQRRRSRTKLPPKTLRKSMEERPKPGRGGLEIWEREEDLT